MTTNTIQPKLPVRIAKADYVRTTALHGIDDAIVRRVRGFYAVEIGTGLSVTGIFSTKRELVAWLNEIDRVVLDTRVCTHAVNSNCPHYS